MKRRLLPAVVLGAAALAVAAQTQAVSAPKLTGTVGPGFTITLKDSTGKKVTKLRAGRYTFVVTDRSSIHNFALKKGASFFKQITSVGSTGKKTATVTLTKGKWEAYCQPHASSMRQRFTVT